LQRNTIILHVSKPRVRIGLIINSKENHLLVCQQKESPSFFSLFFFCKEVFGADKKNPLSGNNNQLLPFFPNAIA
jgi:hypothetical protein